MSGDETRRDQVTAGRFRRVRRWLSERWLRTPGWTSGAVAAVVVAVAVWVFRVVAQPIPGAPLLTARIMVPDLIVAALAALVVLAIVTVAA